MPRKYSMLLSGVFVTLMGAKVTFAQTEINLQNQARDVDFSAALSTKPAQTGFTLPTTCSMGAVFVALGNPPGQNVYVCTSSNVWSLQGGGSGSGSAPNVLTVSAAANILSIGSGCYEVSPCNVRVGSSVYAFVNGMTATLSSGSGTAFVYVSSAGVLTVGHNLTLSCAGGCVAQAGIVGFPTDSYPIAVWTAVNGTWTQGIDARATIGRDLVVSGTGLLSSSSGAATTLSAQPQQGGFSVAFRGTDVAAGETLYLTVPYACTITDWAITSDGTATITLWRVPDGGIELPNDSDTLSTNGFSLTTGTRIHSTVLTDLSSTSIFVSDTFGVNLAAVGGSASHVEFYLGCAQ
jgi:hypothetical protein